MAIDLLISLPEDQKNPYGALEHSYWSQPREVCVVDEINPIDEEENAEVICGRSPKNENWVRTIASLHRFSVEKEEGEDRFIGKYWRFIVRKGKGNGLPTI